MTEETTQPIEAHDSPLPDQAWAALRQFAPAVMAFAIGRGWLSDDLSILLGVLGGVVWPIVAGQLKTRRRATELAILARAPTTPDSLAVIKGAP